MNHAIIYTASNFYGHNDNIIKSHTRFKCIKCKKWIVQINDNYSSHYRVCLGAWVTPWCTRGTVISPVVNPVMDASDHLRSSVLLSLPTDTALVELDAVTPLDTVMPLSSRLRLHCSVISLKLLCTELVPHSAVDWSRALAKWFFPWTSYDPVFPRLYLKNRKTRYTETATVGGNTKRKV